MNGRRYSCILFDADGTLFDYDRSESEALRATLEACGIDMSEDVRMRYRRINAGLWKELEMGSISQSLLKIRRFELLAAELGALVNAGDMAERYLSELSRGSYLIDGAEELVTTLRQEYRLALITNGLTRVQRPRIAGSRLHDAFDPIVISDEVQAAKPDPAIFDMCFELMDGPRKEQVLIVGDSLSSDILGGRRYGIDTCWYNPGNGYHERIPDLRPTYEISALSELPALL